MIFRGTTPVVILKINNEDFDMTTIDICHITIQNDSGRNQKIFNASVDTENKTVSAELTQEDTLAYEEGYIYIQAKFKLVNDRVITHEPIRAKLHDILEEDIL